MATGGFRIVIEFFDKLGMYDVVLPFLLVFTVVFAILEKSKIFGTEKIGDKEYTRKNINAMVAFVIGFIFVASTQAVAVINEALANVALMVIAGLSFLLMIGIFYGEKEDMFSDIGKWRWLFLTIMFIATILIFLWAIKSGDSNWLEISFNYIVNNIDSAAVASLIMGIIIVLIIYFIVKEPKEEKKV